MSLVSWATLPSAAAASEASAPGLRRICETRQQEHIGARSIVTTDAICDLLKMFTLFSFKFERDWVKDEEGRGPRDPGRLSGS